MMMIKPKRIQPNTGAIIPVNVLDTSKSSLDDLFHRFVDFIDATPSTVRTYRASLRQWAKYMRANNITRPTMDSVRSYRSYLKATGKKPPLLPKLVTPILKQRVRSQLSKVGKLYLMITKPTSKRQPPYRSFTKATKFKRICKRRKKKRPRRYHLPKVP